MKTLLDTPLFLPEFVWKAPTKAPLHVFPQHQQDIIKHAALATLGDEDLAAVIDLGTWAPALGRGLILKLPRGWQATGNLQIMVNTPPMSAKTELWKLLAQTLVNAMEEEEKDFDERIKAEMEEELRIKEAKLEEEKDDEERILLKIRIRELKELIKYPRRMRCGDITTETLEYYLKGAGSTIWNTMSEATDHIDKNMICGSHSSYGIYLAGFSGDDCRTDRMNGRNVGAKDNCISTLLLSNLNIKNRMLERADLVERGFWSRFLTFIFESEPADPLEDDYDGVPINVVNTHAQKLGEVFETYRLRTLPDKYNVRKEPLFVTMEKEARLEYLRFCAEMNAFIRRDYPLMRDIFCRLGVQFGHILLVVHAMHHGKQSHMIPMCKQDVERVEELMRWIVDKQLEVWKVSADCKLRETAEKFRDRVQILGGSITQKELQTYKICGKSVKELGKTMSALIRAGHALAFKEVGKRTIHYVFRDPTNSHRSDRALAEFMKKNSAAHALPAEALEKEAA